MYPIFRRVIPSLFLLALVSLLSACRATATPPPPVHYKIGSADSTQYIAREVADAYRRAHPTTTFDFYTSNSTTALRELALNQFQFAFVERNPRADELEHAHAAALELGRDGVYIIVNPNNPLANISHDDLKKIFTGDLNQWSQLGVTVSNSPDDIQVLSREDGSGIRAVMDDKIMQGARLTPTALLLPTNLDMLSYVADHPNAIGYVAANIWDEHSHTNPVGIDSIPATHASIAAGTYPLLQTVFLIVPQPPNLDVSDFLQFLESDQGRAMLYRRISELPAK